MDIQHMRVILHYIGFVMLITEFSHGQSVTLKGPSIVGQGSDAVYTCTGGAAPYTFIWEDLSVIPIVNIFINGKAVTNPSTHPKYVNFGVSENEGTSSMTITNTLVEDEGHYRCVELPAGTGNIGGAELTVEVKSIRNLSVKHTTKSNIDVYEATCEALGGRPDETITWMLGDGPSPCGDPVETLLPAGSGLFSKRSVCAFQADSENNGQTLKCVLSGHQVSDLNGEETTILNMQSAPRADIMTVEIQFLYPSYRVSCNISEADQPNPRIRNYYIYSDSTLIHQSLTGVNFVDVPASEYDLSIVFNCVAENILGSTTTYPPSAPRADIMTVGLQFLNTSQEVRVSCNISDEDQPFPPIRNYYIYSDGILNLIHKSSTGVNFVDVQQSELCPGFEFNCVAGNDLGNTTTYDPPTRHPDHTPCTCVPTGLSAGASSGIAVLATLLVSSVIIIIIQFIMLRRQKTRPELPVNDSMTWMKDCMRLHWTCDIKPCSEMQRSYDASTSYTLHDGRI